MQTLNEEPAPTLKRKVRFNIHDYQHLPADKRYEIIDGDLYRVPAPLTTHQKISQKLNQLILNYVEQHNLGEVLYAPVDVILSNEDIIQPDILYISKNRIGILKKENVQGAPDLVVEILSPSNKQRDIETKYKLYERHGVREYWIVDPEAKSIEVFQLMDEGLKLFRTFIEGTHLRSPLFQNLKFLVSDIF